MRKVIHFYNNAFYPQHFLSVESIVILNIIMIFGRASPRVCGTRLDVPPYVYAIRDKQGDIRAEMCIDF